MKQPWWALLIVAVLGVGVGLGAAGLFANDADPEPATAIDPGLTDTIDPISEPTSTTTSPPTTAPATTEPDATTSTTSTAPSSSAPPSTSTPPTTVAPTTTAPSVEQPPLEEIVIVVANGAGIPLIAGNTAQLLTDLGYPNVEIADGIEIVEFTAIYAAPGLEPTAARIATDIVTIDPEFAAPDVVSPFVGAPAFEPARPDGNIILYLGQDQG